MAKEKVIVSRKWHSPEIELYVDNVEITSRMSLEDFKAAVLLQMGSPTMLLTKGQLNTALDAAITAVVEEMKKSTVQIV